jgi:hypothetical protein
VLTPSVAVLTAGGEFGGRPEASAEVGAARIVERHTEFLAGRRDWHAAAPTLAGPARSKTNR